MKRLSLYFTSPGHVEMRQEPIPPLAPDQILVETLVSAISPGTEGLIYGGLFPDKMCLDGSLAALSGDFSYPLKYGYAAVGRVSACGAQVERSWMERLVFAFNPHETHFTTTPEAVFPLPDEISPEQAVFLPNVETAINLVMDGSPIIGECVVVFGQGIVGLLTAGLLRRFPLDRLITLDRYAMRREASRSLGVNASLDAGDPGIIEQVRNIIPSGADLCFELSGSPAALNQAIAVTGFDGRIVIGSWYGKKTAEVNLGGAFHRSRIRLVSSQVSTIAPSLSGRWTKQRRFELAWEMIKSLQPRQFITQHFTLDQASQAYQLITEHPAETIQVLLTYPHDT